MPLDTDHFHENAAYLGSMATPRFAAPRGAREACAPTSCQEAAGIVAINGEQFSAQSLTGPRSDLQLKA